MIANVMKADVVDGKVNEMARVLREKIIPDIQTMKGCHSATLIADPANNSLMTMTVWETADDLQAIVDSGVMAGALADVKPYVVSMQRTVIKGVFDQFDADGNGTLDREEFETFLKAIGKELSQDAINAAFATADADLNGVIDFKEFVDWVQSEGV